MIKPPTIVTTARTLINTPYQHQGRTPGKGLDCSGVVVLTAYLAGLTNKKWGKTNYPRNSNNSLVEGLEEYCIRIEKLQCGAIALFKISSIPYHCGIISDYADGLGLIHAYSNAGVVAEHELIPWWQDKIVRVYGFPGVSYR